MFGEKLDRSNSFSPPVTENGILPKVNAEANLSSYTMPR